MQTKRLHIILHTIIPSLPFPSLTSQLCHLHLSTGRHPIIPILTFHMPKHLNLLRLTTPSHALNTQKTVQIHSAFPILQRHPAHPSHHHAFCSLQTLQTCFLHRPGFSPICQRTLDTSLVYLSLKGSFTAPDPTQLNSADLNSTSPVESDRALWSFLRLNLTQLIPTGTGEFCKFWAFYCWSSWVESGCRHDHIARFG